MGFFQTLRQVDLASKIDAARNFVVYAAPGLSATVAGALMRAVERLGAQNVVPVLDVSAHVARMGFGDFPPIKRLASAGVQIRIEPGLRQGLLICDNEGWALTVPARLIEDDARENQEAPNAIQLTTAQVVALRGELPQPASAPKGLPERAVTSSDPIGSTLVTRELLDRVEKELEVARPQPFDLARQVQVYTALVRFVELEMKGWKLESRRVELPKTLPVLATQDRALKERIRSQLNLSDQIQDGQLRTLRAEVEETRKAFCVPVGPMGSVVLIQAQASLIERIESIRVRLNSAQQTIKEEIAQSLTRVIDGLVPELARAVLRDPPDAFIARFARTEEGAEDYVRQQLRRVFPTADEIVAGMSLRLSFKDVTYDVLKDESFKDKVLMSFSRSVLPGELLTEYDAARKRIEGSAASTGS